MLNEVKRLQVVFMALLLAISLMCSFSVFAEGGIKFLGEETSVMDRVLDNGELLSYVLIANVDQCEAVAALSHNTESRFLRCVRRSVRELRRDGLITKKERRGLMAAIAAITGDDDDSDDDTPPGPTSSAVNGRVTLADGSTVEAVLLVATATDGTVVTGTSDASGNFSLELVGDTEYTVQFSANGFADQVANVMSPPTDGSISLNITMIERNVAQDVVEGAATVGTDGASVTASASQFVDVDGNAVAGILQVNITPINTSNPAILASFPGEFSGIPEGATEDSAIYTLGTVEYEFNVVQADGTEVPVNLDDSTGQTVVIQIPIYGTAYQNGDPILVGDSIPLWSLNEGTGLWEQEGEGTVVASASSPTGLALEATVTHFSWWNCDVSAQTALVQVTVVGAQGGTALVSATTTLAGAGGWRGDTVNSVMTIGIQSNPMTVPANTEICYSADVTYTGGSMATTNEVCITAAQGTIELISLTSADEGPLNIVANNIEGPLVVEGFVNFPMTHVNLNSTTLESGVTYAITTGALPMGMSLNVVNGTQAEIVGVPIEFGLFSVTVTGTDTTDAEVDMATINYLVLDAEPAPIFSGELFFVNLTNVSSLERDLNTHLDYLNSGAVTSWAITPGVLEEPLPSWLALNQATGVISYVGELPTEANPVIDLSWNGKVTASNASGSDNNSIYIYVTLFDELVIEFFGNNVSKDEVSGIYAYSTVVDAPITFNRIEPTSSETNEVTYTIVSGVLPVGATLEQLFSSDQQQFNRARIIGVPTEIGIFPIVVEANDGIVTRQISIVFEVTEPWGPVVMLTSGAGDGVDLRTVAPNGESGWSLEQVADGDPVPTMLTLDDNGFLYWNGNDSFTEWSGQLFVIDGLENLIFVPITVVCETCEAY